MMDKELLEAALAARERAYVPDLCGRRQPHAEERDL